MSAGIYILDPQRQGIALPETLRDFGALLERFGGAPDAVNPAFVELGRRLEAGLPAGSWLSSPAREAGEVRSAIWNLGLPDIEMIAAERLIAASVQELGLIAYDDQIGVGFLPDGRIVPEAHRPLWEATLAAIDSGETVDGAAGFRKYVVGPLQEVLAPHGFILQKKTKQDGDPNFIRTLGAIRQKISARPMRYGQLEMSLAVYHDALTAYSLAGNPNGYDTPAFFLNLDFFDTGPDLFPRWKVERPQDVLPLVELVRRKVIPLADFCRDLHGLDQLLNDESADAIRSRKARWMWKHRPAGSDGSIGIRDQMRTWWPLFIAHLAGNPREAQVAERVDKHFERPGDLRDDYLKVKAALRGIAPLARWRDAEQHARTMRPIPRALLERSADPRAARAHHYEVAHMLQEEAESDPAGCWRRYAAEDGDSHLLAAWQAQAQTLPAEDRLEPAGLSREMRTVPGIEVLLLHLPPPPQVGEMAIIALARRGETYRVYTLANEHLLRRGRYIPRFQYKEGTSTSTRELRLAAGAEQLLAYIAETFAAPAAA